MIGCGSVTEVKSGPAFNKVPNSKLMAVMRRNAEKVKELALLKRINVEQTFAKQVYANFQSIRFGIEACCYTDMELAVIRKDLCD